MSLVVDASVAIKWFVAEVGRMPPGQSSALAIHSLLRTSWCQRPVALPSPLRLLLHRPGRGRICHPGNG